MTMYALINLFNASLNAFSVIILIIIYFYTIIYLCSCVLLSSVLKDAFPKRISP